MLCSQEDCLRGEYASGPAWTAEKSADLVTFVFSFLATLRRVIW